MEKWKAIPGYEGKYEVSDLGNIRSVKSNRVLSQTRSSNGYWQISLCINGGTRTHKVHRLVLASFIGVSDLDVDHINGVRTDNRLENLRYCTYTENLTSKNVKKRKRKYDLPKGRYLSFHKASGRYVAIIKEGKKTTSTKYFKTLQEGYDYFSNCE